MDQRLTEDSVVTISLPNIGRQRDFNATVVARVKSGVVLQPLNADIELVPKLIENVYMSFVSGTGLVALKGTVSRERVGLRFRVQDGVRVHGRRYTRVDAELRVTLRHVEDTKSCPGTTVNIAQEGMLVNAPLQVSLDDRLEVQLTLPGFEEPLKFNASVVRHAGGLIALHFFGEGPVVQAAIAEFVVERRLHAMSPEGAGA